MRSIPRESTQPNTLSARIRRIEVGSIPVGLHDGRRGRVSNTRSQSEFRALGEHVVCFEFRTLVHNKGVCLNLALER